MSHMINFRADDELYERLERLAKLTGRSKTFYVRTAVAAHLEELEDIYLADQVMDRIDSGEDDVNSLEAVERELGLAH